MFHVKHFYLLALFKATIKAAIAAGVIPEILEAAPMVKGRTAFNFNRTSFERLIFTIS